MLTLLLTLVPLARPAAAQQFQGAPQAPPSRITSPAPATTGGFLGGVPSGTATGDVMTITVLDAIRRALRAES